MLKVRKLALLLCALLLLSGCSIPPAPERKVAEFLDKLSEGSIKSAGKLTTAGSLGLDKKASDLYKPLFGSIRYSIGGSVTEGDSSRVSVTVMIIDMEELMAEASAEMVSHMLGAGVKHSDEIFYELLREKLADANPPTVTSTATAKLVKDGYRWKIELSASGGFADAVTGGVGDVFTEG